MEGVAICVTAVILLACMLMLQLVRLFLALHTSTVSATPSICGLCSRNADVALRLFFQRTFLVCGQLDSVLSRHEPVFNFKVCCSLKNSWFQNHKYFPSYRSCGMNCPRRLLNHGINVAQQINSSVPLDTEFFKVVLSYTIATVPTPFSYLQQRVHTHAEVHVFQALSLRNAAVFALFHSVWVCSGLYMTL